MRVVNNSERAIFVADTMLVPTVPTELADEVLEHPRVKELFKDKEITKAEDEEVS